jgi:6-phosphogluconolactonase
MMPQIQILPDAAAVARAAADTFVAAQAEALAARGRFAVALAGGSTPKAMNRLLAGAADRDRVDWARVEIFFGDERCVPPDHADSNYRMTKETLLDHVPIDPARVHRIRGEDSPEEAALAYTAEIARLGAPLDLVLLGMGPDGHTASLFPGTPAVDDERPGAVAVWVPRLSAWRVTLTAPVLSAAAAVLIAATGAEKAETLAAVMERKGRFPVERIQSARLTWLVDREAASRLGTVIG